MKPCLIVVSAVPDAFGVKGGVSGHSLRVSFSEFSRQSVPFVLASPDGTRPEIDEDAKVGLEWISANNALLSTPKAIHEISAYDYCGLCVPDGIGAMADLRKDPSFNLLLKEFVKENKTVCLIGYGVAAACFKPPTEDWCLKSLCLTGAPNATAAKNKFFHEFPVVIEDFIRENDARFSSSVAGNIHVVLDGKVITAQDDKSTQAAVTLLCFMCTQDQKRVVQ